MRSLSATLKARRLAPTSPDSPAGASGEVVGLVISVMVGSCRPTVNYRRQCPSLSWHKGQPRPLQARVGRRVALRERHGMNLPTPNSGAPPPAVWAADADGKRAKDN